jgi:hypothetical protein
VNENDDRSNAPQERERLQAEYENLPDAELLARSDGGTNAGAREPTRGLELGGAF